MSDDNILSISRRVAELLSHLPAPAIDEPFLLEVRIGTSPVWFISLSNSGLEVLDQLDDESSELPRIRITLQEDEMEMVAAGTVTSEDLIGRSGITIGGETRLIMSNSKLFASLCAAISAHPGDN